ncbi:MAG: SUMF1/EgtB/PvdO family nonheme iron enzyme [Thermoguttaceae bacterium]|jgi:formylglycine-generating enzyme required for sulfatase activity|nr:SUMF1/EgtB/PvdO family nonheme iron enzyme [Thermoguttaceae bacterium]
MKTCFAPRFDNASTFILFAAVCAIGGAAGVARSDGPAQGTAKKLDLGGDVTLEVVYIPPGEFMMGSTPEERAWATGPEGGATPGTSREKPEGDPRPTRVRNGFWMGRTEVTVGQFRRFVEETGYVTDAEQPGATTHCFDHEWVISGKAPPHPWKAMEDKSWRDPNFPFPVEDNHPVVCVSWNDGRAFCRWLTQRERDAGRLPEGLEYRLPTEAEWAYACRGGSKESLYYWWGNDLKDGEGRLNISAVDFLPGRNKIWPLANVPWSDGFAFVAPVDHYGERGRNGFGLADMLGNVWEIVLDHFDPQGAHEEVHLASENIRPVCRGGNYFDVPGNARCAVRLGLRGPDYSDSRDGFRICLGVPRGSGAE